jgi:hypothetical protein
MEDDISVGYHTRKITLPSSKKTKTKRKRMMVWIKNGPKKKST